MNRKLLVIGLDGATFNLILPWVREGKLPNIKKIMNDGIHTGLMSTKPPMTCPAWPAFMTGKNPGKFGVCDFIISDSDITRVVNFSDIKAEPFWDIAGRSDIPSIIVNVPITYPARINKGILLSGMLTPRGEVFWSHEKVIEDIRRDVGEYQVDLDLMSLSSLGKKRSLQKLYDLSETQFKTMKYLMEKYPFDTMVGVFQITDIVCHRLWHRKAEILKAYQKVDEYLRWFTKHKEYNLFIISDHGFRDFSKRIRINQYLLDLGLLVKRQAISQDGVTRGSSEIQSLRFGGRKRLVQRVFRSSKGLFLALGISRNGMETFLKKTGLYAVMRKHTPNVFKRFLPPSRHAVDYARSMAYLHSSRTRCIVINQDLISKHSSYADFRDYLKRKLLDLKDQETGQKAISKVFFREEIYSGKYMDKMPDIYLEPSEGYLIRSGFGSTVISDFAVPKSQHDPSGILLAKGPDIRTGSLPSVASIVDLAPTFLHLMGLAIPEDMDGEVLFEIFNKDSEPHKRPASFIAPVERAEDESFSISAEQECLIRERLRGLGYID